jgi:hypothetical protein
MSEYGIVVRLLRRGRPEDTVELGPEQLREFGLVLDRDLSDASSAQIAEAVRRGIAERGAWNAELTDVQLVLRDYTIHLDTTYTRWAEARSLDHPAPDPIDRRVSRCRSILELANLALPSSLREDALDEWMDEIQTAAEQGLPIRRRAFSILLRSLPALALRARLPVRARRREG